MVCERFPLGYDQSSVRQLLQRDPGDVILTAAIEMIGVLIGKLAAVFVLFQTINQIKCAGGTYLLILQLAILFGE